jgi:hypothetical protein
VEVSPGGVVWAISVVEINMHSVVYLDGHPKIRAGSINPSRRQCGIVGQLEIQTLRISGKTKLPEAHYFSQGWSRDRVADDKWVTVLNGFIYGHWSSWIGI